MRSIGATWTINFTQQVRPAKVNPKAKIRNKTRQEVTKRKPTSPPSLPSSLQEKTSKIRKSLLCILFPLSLFHAW